MKSLAQFLVVAGFCLGTLGAAGFGHVKVLDESHANTRWFEVGVAEEGLLVRH